MESLANNTNTWAWWRNQNRDVWLNINDIPSSMFWSIWNIKIESDDVELHPTEAKYKKKYI